MNINITDNITEEGGSPVWSRDRAGWGLARSTAPPAHLTYRDMGGTVSQPTKAISN